LLHNNLVFAVAWWGVAIYVHRSLLFNVLLSGPAGLELIFVSLIKINAILNFV